MGMLDEIRCEVPLPDGYDSGGAWFQTKSFPDRRLCRYTITREGRLIDTLGNDLCCAAVGLARCGAGASWQETKGHLTANQPSWEDCQQLRVVCGDSLPH